MYDKLLKIDCLQSQFENEIKEILKDKFKMLVFDNKKLAFKKEKAFILLNDYSYIIVYYKKYKCTQNNYIKIIKLKGGIKNDSSSI